MTDRDAPVVRAAVAVIAGIIVSGPLALLVVHAVHAQPSWSGAARFAAEYHPIQLLPYAGGFVLIGGCIALVAALHAGIAPEHRARATVALALAAVFGALIGFNYVLQTTYVPSLVSPGDDVLIAALAMANPRSLAWPLELWGYAVYGVATWGIACAFSGTRLERAVARLYVGNGIASVAGALATMRWPGWAMSPAGLVLFAAWNVLIVVMAAATIVAMRRRGATDRE